jgi:hypothetical protein
LVDEALARHPEVILLAMHAAPPVIRTSSSRSNFGRIGKIGYEDDMRCIHTGNSNPKVNGNHFEDEVVMKDQSGEPIGARGVVFNYKPGDDKAIFVKILQSDSRRDAGHDAQCGALFGPGKMRLR